MTEQLPHLPDVERISPRVLRILGGNPGKFTLQGTNTYLVGQGSKRILIDTGEGRPVWSQSLKKALADEGASLDRIILTHWHPDHVGGVRDALQLQGCTDAKVFKSQIGTEQEKAPPTTQQNIENGQIFKTEGATLRAFHCPGHTVDHMALILEEEDAMFTGDNVLGHGTAVFEDLAAYMDSLERMQQQCSGRAYPGHGAVIEDGKAKIREYISHRREREEQVLGVMRGEPPRDGEGWKSMSMVKVIYKDYPEDLHGPGGGECGAGFEEDGRGGEGEGGMGMGLGV